MKKFFTLLLLFIVSASVAGSLASATTNSLTYDEVAHIGAGYSYLTEHDFRLNPEHPPTLKAFSTVPLLLLNPIFSIATVPSWHIPYNIGEYGQWDVGRALLHESGNNTDQITFWARLPMVVIFAFTSFFIFFWTKKLAACALSNHRSKSNLANAAGFLAVVMWTCNPNILGHNHLVTTDVGAAGAFSLCLYFFIRFVKLPNYKNTLILGILFGIANTIKFSTFILVPFFGIMIVLYIILLHLNKNQSDERPIQIKNYIGKSILMGIVTLLTIFIIYIPFSFATPKDVLENIVPLKIHNMERPIDVWSKETILSINDVPALRPLALYLFGVTQVFHRVAGGNNTYFLGNVSPNQADILYFPTVFTLKEPLLYLFTYLITVSLVIYAFVKTTVIKSANHSAKLFFLKNYSLCVLVLFIIFYILITANGNLTIGIRHLFPLYPPLFILCGISLITLYKKVYTKKQKIVLSLTYTAFLVLFIFQAIIIFPTYLSFFNAFAGGTQNGHNFVVDSNTDWGQSTKRLLTYLKEESISQIHMQYFGGDDITNRFAGSGIDVIPLLPTTRPIKPGYYVISATPLQESIFAQGATYKNSYLWTKNFQPVAQIDGSFLIFFVPNNK